MGVKAGAVEKHPENTGKNVVSGLGQVTGHVWDAWTVPVDHPRGAVRPMVGSGGEVDQETYQIDALLG